jgi:hypothetical protein
VSTSWIVTPSAFAHELVKLVTDEAAAGIHRRFADTYKKQGHAEHNVHAGRAPAKADVAEQQASGQKH